MTSGEVYDETQQSPADRKDSQPTDAVDNECKIPLAARQVGLGLAGVKVMAALIADHGPHKNGPD